MDQMAPLLDSLFVHAYVVNPSTSYSYVSTRLGYIQTSNQNLGKNVQVSIIFSGEGNSLAAGAEHFMGDWYQTNCLYAAEDIFRTSYEAASYPNIQLNGFQLYEYFFVREYANLGNCPNPCGSSNYYYADGSCQTSCSAPFVTGAQKTCYSPCSKNVFTNTDSTCSATCASPNIAHTFVGGQAWCEASSNSNNNTNNNTNQNTNPGNNTNGGTSGGSSSSDSSTRTGIIIGVFIGATTLAPIIFYIVKHCIKAKPKNQSRVLPNTSTNLSNMSQMTITHI
jgi:hypothetical protein